MLQEMLNMLLCIHVLSVTVYACQCHRGSSWETPRATRAEPWNTTLSRESRDLPSYSRSGKGQCNVTSALATTSSSYHLLGTQNSLPLVFAPSMQSTSTVLTVIVVTANPSSNKSSAANAAFSNGANARILSMNLLWLVLLAMIFSSLYR